MNAFIYNFPHILKKIYIYLLVPFSPIADQVRPQNILQLIKKEYRLNKY